MTDANMQTVEINGVKLEIDLRTARRIDTLRVGSRVKVLVKTYSDFKIYPGVVVGFDPFQQMPSITVAYMDIDWSTAALKFIAINAATKNTEIVAAMDADHLELSRDEILAKMDRQIATEEAKLQELTETRAFFLRKFGEYFTPSKTESIQQ